MADAKTEKQKVKEITDKLEEGLKELFGSEKYKSYLSTMSKFHNYSVNNTLLIALQRPDASLVAGYQAWQKNFNRHVNKGERGIRILASYKIKEERDKLDPVTGEVMLDKDGMPQTEEVEVKIPAFRAVSVFDVKQTSGEPIPELEAIFRERYLFLGDCRWCFSRPLQSRPLMSLTLQQNWYSVICLNLVNKALCLFAVLL